MHDDTVKQKLNSLQRVYEVYKDDKPFSVKTIFELHGLHSDLAKFLNDDKVLIRTEGGLRGPGKYRWVGKKPDMQMARSLIARFNSRRDSINKKSTGRRKSELQMLIEKVDLIIKHLNIT